MESFYSALEGAQVKFKICIIYQYENKDIHRPHGGGPQAREPQAGGLQAGGPQAGEPQVGGPHERFPPSYLRPDVETPPTKPR